LQVRILPDPPLVQVLIGGLCDKIIQHKNDDKYLNYHIYYLGSFSAICQRLELQTMKSILNFVALRFAHARRRLEVFNPSMGWRNTISALLLFTLFLGSLNQSLPVQAAPVGNTEFRFSMEAIKLNGTATICVGDNVPINIKVRRSEMVGGDLGYGQFLPGVKIQAIHISNPSVGTLNQNTIYTGWNSNDPPGADLMFHVVKVGSTTISFKGTINHIWWLAELGFPPVVDRRDFVNATVDITVEECQYKVLTVSHFLEQGVKLTARMEGMLHGADGHYSGTGTENWIGGIAVAGDCSSAITVYTSDATLTGELEGDTLKVSVVYSPAFLENIGGCPSGVVDQDWVTPDPLGIAVPASIGGGEVQYQNLNSTSYYSMHGTVDVVIYKTDPQ
jgi:hypothetical protein